MVALDPARTRLQIVLAQRVSGQPVDPRGNGLIPAEERKSGLLLRAVSGGLRTANATHGTMPKGIVALPKMPGMARIAIDYSGAPGIAWVTRLGKAWGWKQNPVPVVQDNGVLPRVRKDSVAD